MLVRWRGLALGRNRDVLRRAARKHPAPGPAKKLRSGGPKMIRRNGKPKPVPGVDDGRESVPRDVFRGGEQPDTDSLDAFRIRAELSINLRGAASC